MPTEAAAHYASDVVDLQFSEEEYQVLKKLLALTKEYMQARLAIVLPAGAVVPRSAAYKMDDLDSRLQHLEGQTDKRTFIEGDVIVFLAQPSALITTNPQFRANHEFMRSEQTVQLLAKLKTALDAVHIGYRHPWMLH